jgi:hypothetical protein
MREEKPIGVEVRKIDKVTVLMFTRHKIKPLKVEKSLSLERVLLRLRFLFPCRAEIIKADDLLQLITKTFGSEYEYYIFISDSYFRTISREAMQKLLEEDDTNELPYIEESSDCDDFSDVLLGQLTKKTWTQGYAIGQLWYYTDQFGHAVNLFSDGEKIYVVEPQNDGIYEWCENNFYCGKAYLVKF